MLFRGNAEAVIRENLVRKGYIKGIIGLPPNLFYGTGIPACIVVHRQGGRRDSPQTGIFMIDASAGFQKDGPKNRLREQDIHRIVDVFTRQAGDPEATRGWSRLAEIEKNDYNLNIPRYIDSQQSRRTSRTSTAHLRGGIPSARRGCAAALLGGLPRRCGQALFAELRPGYLCLAVDKAAIKPTIYEHPEFAAFRPDGSATSPRGVSGTVADAQGAAARLRTQGADR